MPRLLRRKFMNRLVWAEWSNVDEENEEKVKNILNSFDQIINGLYLLSDVKYVSNMLNSSDREYEVYHELILRHGSLSDLAEEFEILRSVLFGGILDWSEIMKD